MKKHERLEAWDILDIIYGSKIAPWQIKPGMLVNMLSDGSPMGKVVDLVEITPGRMAALIQREGKEDGCFPVNILIPAEMETRYDEKTRADCACAPSEKIRSFIFKLFREK